MKSSIVLVFILAMLVFVSKTNARASRGKSSDELDAESDFTGIHRHIGSGRRTRHSRQTFPSYSHPSYERFESSSLYQLEEINMKLKLLSEQLSSRPISCPSPVVLPYPYPLPTVIKNTTPPPNINGRINPVWGIVGDEAEAPSDIDDYDDGSRPISFEPSKQEVPEGVLTPPVEHGSIQGEAPKKTLPTPTKCQAAMLSCCRFDEAERKSCFENQNCSRTYATGKACLPEAIDMVIKTFVDTYKPR